MLGVCVRYVLDPLGVDVIRCVVSFTGSMAEKTLSSLKRGGGDAAGVPVSTEKTEVCVTIIHQI
jgi:hypothetical protein